MLELPPPKKVEFGCKVFSDGKNLTILHQGTKEEDEEASFVRKQLVKVVSIFEKRNKIELHRERDETYYFLNLTDKLSFVQFSNLNLYSYRYDHDPIVNSIDTQEKLDRFL